MFLHLTIKMERVFVKEIRKIKGLKAKIEKAFNVELKITRTHIEVTGKDEDGFSEYMAGKAIEAIGMNFIPETALLLKNAEYMFEKVDIKDHVKQSRVTAVKGRTIGRGGKAKLVLERLTNCEIEVKGHYIGIIGKAADVTLAINSIIKLIQGSPHSKVYAFLERHQQLRKERIDEEESLSYDKEK